MFRSDSDWGSGYREDVAVRFETQCWNVFGVLKSIDVTEDRVNCERRGCSKALAN